jgi:phthiocerol/phenolphthiocerol synthesis type-I polyketide synthase E
MTPMTPMTPSHGDTAIAVIGLACRLPGADTPDALWADLIAGRESITFFDEAGAPVASPASDPTGEDRRPAGRAVGSPTPRDPASPSDPTGEDRRPAGRAVGSPTPRDPASPIAGEGELVRAAGLVDGAERFDAALFGFSRLEATMLDPQHRVFLEAAYAALDAAGCDPRRYPGPIGVYAGGSETPYLALLRAHRDQLAGATDWQLRLATGIDFLTSRTAYELGLRGPAITVQTGCSTSLVAIHVAAQALLAGDCDLALAGGATINVPVQLSPYTEGGILSPDGRCRAFDARARGTVGADGVVVVALKRLADALADRDHVHAVLLGSAVNNDADAKIGFTAPSVEGQVRVIRAAHRAAQVEPHTIGFVEAHGTGTALGDPIEVAALHRAFAGHPGRCWLGSIKTNLGHTDAAAGAAGFLKAVLAIERRQVPPTLHFTTPNPQLALERGPFAINAEPCAWPDRATPRRAGVSSFGIGGTNAHAVLEEAPAPARSATPAGSDPGPQLLVLSAASRASLDRAAEQLAAHLAGALQRGETPALADVAWTLQVGRQQHALRRFAVCTTPSEAIAALADPAPPAIARDGAPRVVFMFPGQGGQRVDMARGLYRAEPVFRDAVDRCCRLAEPALGLDLRAVLYPPEGDAGAAARAKARLAEMDAAQVAVFAVEIALAELWRYRGVTPDAVVGHSLGAYAAAAVAGVLSLEDALALVLARSRLLARLAPGAMLAVPLPEAEIAGRLGAELSISAVNAPSQCTVSGPVDAIEALRRELAAVQVEARVLHIPRPAHSRALDPLLGELEAAARAIELRPPRLPWVSDMTGGWVSAEEATDPRYFARHLRRTVRFADALSTIFDGERAALIEVGPGRALTHLARQHPRAGAHVAIATLPHPTDPTPDTVAALDALGRLWAAGGAIAWDAVHGGHPRWRIPLPTYAFDRQRYAIARPTDAIARPEAADQPPGPTAPPEPGPPAAPDGSIAADRIARIFGEVLGLAEVAPHDNFFERGGDSLMAAQLAAKLRATFPGVAIRPRTVFQAPTVAGMARWIAGEATTAARREPA